MLWFLIACRPLLLPGLPSRQEVARAAQFAPADLIQRPVAVQPPLCPAPAQPGLAEIQVRVTGPDGNPVQGVAVGHRRRNGTLFVQDAVTDAGPVSVLVPLGMAVVVDAESQPAFICASTGAVEFHLAAAAAAAEPPVPDQPPVEVHGFVRFPDGTPVAAGVAGLLPTNLDRSHYFPGAKLVKTGIDGSFSLEVVAPDHAVTVTAAWEDQEALRTIPVEPGQSVGLDMVLGGGRRVEVRCAGLPNDSCAGMILPECSRDMEDTSYWSGVDNVEGVRQSWTHCPDTEAVVNVGSTAVRVGPTDVVAWLDFRHYASNIRGTLSGGDSDCRVVLARDGVLPLLFRLPFDEFILPVDADHHFSSGPMPDGPYRVTIGCGQERRQAQTVTLKGQPMEVALQWAGK